GLGGGMEGEGGGGASGWWERIDEPGKGCLTGQRKIDSPTEIGRRDCLPRHTVDGLGESRRIEPGCIDEAPTADAGWLISADGQIETVGANPTGQNRSAQYDHCSGHLGLTLESEH